MGCTGSKERISDVDIKVHDDLIYVVVMAAIKGDKRAIFLMDHREKWANLK